MRRQKLPEHEAPSPVSRRGAAIVEFAIMAPLFLMLTLGTVELGYALNASNTLYGALREGGRLASQDFGETLQPGQTANQKVTLDLKNMLTAARIPGGKVTITIEHADQPGSTFDLEDPDNYLELFTIRTVVNYEDVSLIPGKWLGGEKLKAALTFRLGRVQVVN